ASAARTRSPRRWLETPGVRLVQVEGGWSLPIGGAGRFRARIELAYRSREQYGDREGRPRR
ncbi:endonuclease, partial [Streptosporangium saharense]